MLLRSDVRRSVWVQGPPGFWDVVDISTDMEIDEDDYEKVVEKFERKNKEMEWRINKMGWINERIKRRIRENEIKWGLEKMEGF
jgi:hypothetical protein